MLQAEERFPADQLLRQGAGFRAFPGPSAGLEPHVGLVQPGRGKIIELRVGGSCEGA
jgi:hypothetical protein